jgi:N-acetylmuramoyl-L-alanine amidase
MILAQFGLRRHSVFHRRLVIGILLTLGSAGVVLGSNWDREGAKRAWNDATRLHDALSQSAEPSRETYLTCIRTYQLVYTKDPHFISSGEAIYQAAKLYQELGDKFGDVIDYRNAAKLYRFFTTDYDGHKLCPDALRRLGKICEGPLADGPGAATAYEKLRTRYKLTPAASLASKTSGTSVKPAPSVAAAEEPASKPPVAGVTGHSAVRAIRFSSEKNSTRVTIDLAAPARYTESHLANPERIYFDIENATLDHSLVNDTIAIGDRFVKQVRIAQNQHDIVRVVFDLDELSECSVSKLESPAAIVVDIRQKSTGTTAAVNPQRPPASPDFGKGTVAPPLAKAPVSHLQTDKTDSKPPGEKPVISDKQERELQPRSMRASGGTAPPAPGPKEAAKTNTPPAPVVPRTLPSSKPAIPTSKGDRTLTRTLGLKIGRIVLDPGHGGHDMGTIGPGGLLEKDLVLQVAKNLQKMIEEKLGAEVILTRTDDTFVSLEERTAIANQQQADLFVSIHANSSPSRNTSGVETYFLDFARTDSAREIAARENAASDRNVRDLQDLIQEIAQADKIQESRELAAIVQKNLYAAVRKMMPAPQDRGVHSAPFVVLIGAHMPSVLAEVAFISNPRDEKLLKKEANQQSLATALFRGIESYMKTLGSGVVPNHGNPN